MELYARNGGTRLVLLHLLCRGLAVHVEQSWESAAWCWRVLCFNPSAGRRLGPDVELIIQGGPVPAHLSLGMPTK